ncbi:hypothetical protein BDW02DRAFT_243258 [Decorospora gaudefroyi]|uniref:C3H1-type domain-containing protein n=1 Tax=Decorospora gaudefroyi TaxID=184978 RepID=A0A6A5JVH5_9PLEO|nr:hypothetical protein BDW02DRAFT_243258 [Decorospora gaudefroyi]
MRQKEASDAAEREKKAQEDASQAEQIKKLKAENAAAMAELEKLKAAKKIKELEAEQAATASELEKFKAAKKIKDLEAEKAATATELEKFKATAAARPKRQEQERDRNESARKALQETAEVRKLALQELKKLQNKGQITATDLEQLEAPSKESCLAKLKEIWNRWRQFAVTISPQDLFRDRHLLLQFEVEAMLDAYCNMSVLLCRGCTNLEPHSTGWDYNVMIQLQRRLSAFEAAEGGCPSNLISSVSSICGILQAGLQQEEQRVQAADHFSKSMGSSMTTNMTANSSIFQPQTSLGTSLGTSVGVNNGSFVPPFQTTSITSLPGNSLVPMDLQVLNEPDDMDMTDNGSSRSVFGGSNSTRQPNPFSLASQSLGSSGKLREACRSFKKGICRKGNKCKHPHKACTHWLKNRCSRGDNCTYSHDPFFLQGAPNARSEINQASLIA